MCTVTRFVHGVRGVLLDLIGYGAVPSMPPEGKGRGWILGAAALLLVVIIPLMANLFPSDALHDVAREEPARRVPLETGLNDPSMVKDRLAARHRVRLDKVKAAGGRWIRVDVQWDDVEPRSRGRYSESFLADLDRLVASMQARGLGGVFVLERSPCWAVRPGGACGRTGNSPPADPRDYGNVLAMLAKRYAGRRVVWEMWNEPNLDYFFNSQDNAADYSALIKAAYPIAKREAPGVTLIAGALSLADFGFLEAMYGHGVKGHFDAFSVHPYSPSGGSDSSDYGLRHGVPAIRALMLTHGDDKPLWLTEVGTPSTAPANEHTQAQHLTQIYATVRRWSYVRAALWYETRDDASGEFPGFGLYRSDWSAKPSLSAFRAASCVRPAAPSAAPHCAIRPPRSARRQGRS
jgi:polysaccharide biosynthesis protein PslG